MRPENRATADEIRETVAAVYRAESRAVLATLIRLLGDFELAEEALHEAFRAALEQWPRDGVPDRPRAWLVSAGRFKAIDQLRRQARLEPLDIERHDVAAEETASPILEGVPDDRLRLIFTCCHPALAPDAQVALTLREVCGLATEEQAVRRGQHRRIHARAAGRNHGRDVGDAGPATVPGQSDGPVLRYGQDGRHRFRGRSRQPEGDRRDSRR